GRGATAAILGTLAFLLFSQSTDEALNAVSGTEGFHPFQVVILAVSVFTLLSGVLVWFVIPVSSDNSYEKQTIFDKKKILILLRLPKMWMLAIMIVCAYVGYKITDDYSLFAKEVLGYSDVEAAGVGTAALWMRALVAILAGFIADRLNKVNLISTCFGLAVAGGLLIGLGVLSHITVVLILNLIMTMIGVYGVRALYFSVLKEAQIPLTLTGTAVGIVSFVGYTPDVFMSPWMGYLLDNNPGVTGHQYVFLVLASFATVGLLTSLAFGRRNTINKPEKNSSPKEH
ncbi:MFS transporter, partial [Desulfosarcina sp.]|nr:MFS transporter [Desulfosarcina sp.]